MSEGTTLPAPAEGSTVAPSPYRANVSGSGQHKALAGALVDEEQKRRNASMAASFDKLVESTLELSGEARTLAASTRKLVTAGYVILGVMTLEEGIDVVLRLMHH